MLERLRMSEIQEKIAAKVLGTMAPLAVVGIAIAIIAAAFVPGQQARVLPDLLLAAFLVLVWWTVHKGKIRLAAHMFTTGLCVAIVVGMALNGGVLAPIYVLSVVTIALIVLLYGPRVAIFFPIAFMVVGGVFVYLDMLGVLREAPPAPPWLIWVFISIDCLIILGATAIPNRLLHQTLEESERRRVATEEVYQREKQSREALAANQETLQKINARYEALFEQAGDGICLMNTNGNALSINKAFARMHGYTVEEILLLGIKELDVKGDLSVAARLNQIMAGEPTAFEVEHYHKDGHILPLSVTANLVDSGGERVIIVSHHDLTERKRVEHALQESERRASAMLGAVPDMMFRMDSQGVFLGYKADINELYVQSEETIIGKRNREVTPPEFADLIERQIRRTLETRALQTFEYQIPVPDRGMRDYEARMIASGADEVTAIVRDVTERKRTEAALASESEFNRLIIQSAGQGICVCHETVEFPYVRFSVWNDSMIQITGYSMAEINRLGWYQALYPDPELQERAISRMQSMREGDDIQAEEWEITRADGQKRQLLITTRINTASSGERYVLGVMSDVTERKHAETEVQRAYDFVGNVLNAIGEPVFVKDEEHRFVLINDAECLLVGYSREELIGKNDMDFFPPEQVDVFWKMDQQVLATGEGNINEEVVTDARTGDTRAIVTRKTRYIDPQGKRYIVGISRDVTERRKSEEALRVSEERFRIAVECTSDFIYERDMQSGEADFFGDIEGCLGYERGAFPTTLTGWLEYIHPDDIAQVLETLQKASGKDGRYILEYRLKRSNGTYADWLDRGVILRDSAGTPVKCIGGASDVTARKQAEAERELMEERLRQAQKMEAVGLLAGGIAHEFNNLLQVILGLVEIVQMDIGAESADGLLLEDVNRAGQRAADLTQQLLAFSRRQTLMPNNIDLNVLIQGEMNMLAPLIGADIELKFIPGSKLGTVYADRRQLEVVLMNLCVNARDAMPKGGVLTIETENAALEDVSRFKHEGAVAGRYVRLSIVDTGHGMDEIKCSQIFEPFFTTKGVGQGTGLGLATVYGIVTQHKGIIDVSSELGMGTTFDIYLPVVDECADEMVSSKRVLGPGGRETILIAEDDEMLLPLLERILTKAGYNVLSARNGEEALRVFTEHRDEIELALLDVIMPVLGGQYVMESIQAASSRVRFLFSSGYSENAIQTDFIIKEGLRLVKKPYKSVELLRAIRETLDESR